ncbi:uncharacterized protein LOC120412457 [Culex pipiens pallens]|uniref:uncharacterized protein LOC120412457 n=1 Tax=Culex pipiens pallens TaxID=42434 RepID=UPI001954078C|nr:uncharacterized protein LOC120412457 [Culex pipiens pallens]
MPANVKQRYLEMDIHKEYKKFQDLSVGSTNTSTDLTASGDSVMPARRPNWGSLQADGLLAEAAPLKSILQVKIGNGITIVAQCLKTFVALVWSPYPKALRGESKNLQDGENFRRASSELTLK